jgi:hypothetical protein
MAVVRRRRHPALKVVIPVGSGQVGTILSRSYCKSLKVSQHALQEYT